MKKRIQRLTAIIMIVSLILSLVPMGVFAQSSDRVNVLPSDPLQSHAVSSIQDLGFKKLNEARQKKIDSFKEKNAVYLSKHDPLGNQDNHASDEWVRVIVTLKGDTVLDHFHGSPSQFGTSDRQLARSYEQTIESKQTKFLSALKQQQVPYVLKHTFTQLINGISLDVHYKDVDKIRTMPDVIDVQLAQMFYPDLASKETQPDMYFSAPLIGAPSSWATGYDGKDVIVAVVDTGINYFHPAFGGTGKETLKLGGSEDLTEKGGYSERVIGGYNWADDNNDIVDRTDSQHGVHVAGTVGGYDATSFGTINGQPFRGVAPNVKFLAEKVFSNDPDRASTFSDEYMAAVEHAVKHGASVINMSLGSSAGAFNPDDPFYKVMTRASEKGVVFAISAGNSDRSTGGAYPFVENPDVALVGSPSINLPSISVAASMNEAAYYEALQVSPAVSKDDTSEAIAMLPAPSNPSPKSLTEQYEVVYVGLGKDENDYEGENLAGKIALIQRGAVTFERKVQLAFEHGAVAAIIFNNVKNNEFISMATGKATRIPAVFIRGADGEAIKNALESNKAVKITFQTDEKVKVPLAVDTMTSFTSWGYEPSLGFKPTLTAPGGSITSSIGANQYATFNGTSMAAPHVAGASALIIQKFKETGYAYKAEDVRAVLANTAKILMDPRTKKQTPYPIRQQGAGRIQVDQAIKTNVIATYGEEPAVNLRAFTEREKTFSITLRNIGRTPQTFSVSGMMFTDATGDQTITYDQQYKKTLDLLALQLEDGLTLDPETNQVTVPAGATVQLQATVRVPETLPQNRFVEGWLMFTTPEGSEQPSLNVPVYGFYGDWGKPRVIDAHWASPDSYVRYYLMNYVSGEDIGGVSGLYDENGYPLGVYLDAQGKEAFHSEYVAISPNPEAHQVAQPILTLLRNAKVIDVRVLDANGTVLRTLDEQFEVRKHDLKGIFYRFFAGWDGTVKGKPVPDGQYIIEVESEPYGSGGLKQTDRYPVKVVSKRPDVTESMDDSGEIQLTIESQTGIEAVYAIAYDENAGWSQWIAIPAFPKENASNTFAATIRASDFRQWEDKNAPTDLSHALVMMMTVDTAGNETFTASGEPNFILNKIALDGNDIQLDWEISDEVHEVALTIPYQNGSLTLKASEINPEAWKSGVVLPLPYGTDTLTIQAWDKDQKVIAERTLSFDPVNALAFNEKHQKLDAPPNASEVTIQVPYQLKGQTTARLQYTVNDANNNVIKEDTITNAAETGAIDLTLPAPGAFTVTMVAYSDNLELYQASIQTGQDEMSIIVNKVKQAAFDRSVYDATGKDTVELGVVYDPSVQTLTLKVYDPLTNQHLGDVSVTDRVYGGQGKMTYTLSLDAYQGIPDLRLELYVNQDTKPQDSAMVHTGQSGILQKAPNEPWTIYSDHDEVTLEPSVSVQNDVYDAVRLVKQTVIFDWRGYFIDGTDPETVAEAVYGEKSVEVPLDLRPVPDKGTMMIGLTAYDREDRPVGRLYYSVKRLLTPPLMTVLSPEPFAAYNAESGQAIQYRAYLDGNLAEFVDVNSLRLELQTSDGHWIDVSNQVMVESENSMMVVKAEGLQAQKEGYQNMRLSYRDVLGHETQHNRKFYVDLTPPQITLEGITLSLDQNSTPAHRVYRANVETKLPRFMIYGTVTKTLSSFQFSIDDNVLRGYKFTRSTPADAYTFSYGVDLGSQPYTVRMQAIDEVDNMTEVWLTLTPLPREDYEPIDTAPIDTGIGSDNGTGNKEDGTKPPVVETKDVDAGTLEQVKGTDGSKQSLTVSSGAIQKAMQQAKEASSNVLTLNMTDVDLQPGDILKSKISAADVKSIIESGYALEMQFKQFTLTLSADDIKRLLSEDGELELVITLGSTKGMSIRFAAMDKITPLSPVIHVSTANGKLTSPLTLSINVQLGDLDARKVAAYMETEQGVWQHLKSKYDANKNTVQTSLDTLNPVVILAYEKSFDDIKGHWAQDMIEVAASQQLIKGRSSALFVPNANVTRAEFLAMLLRALGEKTVKSDLPFRDVPKNAWYADIVSTAYALNIAKGYGDTFRPDAPISREEMAVMLKNALGADESVTQTTPLYKDASSIAPWAQSAIGWLSQKGYLLGREDGRFAPKDHATRAEAATILYRWIMQN